MTHTAAWLDPLFLSPVVALSFPLPEVDTVTNSSGSLQSLTSGKRVIHLPYFMSLPLRAAVLCAQCKMLETKCLLLLLAGFSVPGILYVCSHRDVNSACSHFSEKCLLLASL